MNKIFIWICGAVLVGLVSFFGYQTLNETKPQKQIDEKEMSANGQDEKSSGAFEEKKNEIGEVNVTVKPLFVINDKEWNFELTLQTHSVELSMDIIESIVLIDAEGSEVKPFEWDGDGPKGHHRTGTARFVALDPIPDIITVLVKNVGEVAVREFEWELQ